MEIRVNQVLRELGISLGSASDYLESNGYNLILKPTSKIDGEVYNVLKHRFGSLIKLDEKTNKVIATRGNKSSDTVGFIKPILVYKNDFETQTLNKQDRDSIFMNTGHIVVKQYYGEIWNKYESTEFFEIYCEEDPSFQPLSSHSLKYFAINNLSNSNKKLPLLIENEINKVLTSKSITLPYNGHQFIFIEENSRVYGPISIQATSDGYDDNEYEYSIMSLPTGFFELSSDFENVVMIFDKEEIQQYLVQNRYGKNDSLENYISNIKNLVSNVKPIDYLLNESEEEIIQIIDKQIPDFNKPKEDWISPTASLNKINELRLNKYLEIKKKSQKWLKYIETILKEDYLNTEKGQIEKETYFKRNQEEIIEEYKKEIEERLNEELIKENQELESKRANILELSEEKSNLEIEISNLNNEKELVKSKSLELKKLEKDFELISEKLTLSKSIETLRKDESIAEKSFAELVKRKEKYETQIETLKTQFSQDSEEVMHKKLLELKPYVDALNGFSPSSKSNYAPPSVLNETIDFYESEETNFEELISELDKYLKGKNRYLKKEEIVNFVTSIQQNFLTVFCGLPGVGKTSLATLIADFFTPKQYFLSIPVSKGWNSRKKLLGYFNPITSNYQYDEYNFIPLLNSVKETNLPVKVLLDEANLSPMEHYWSDFISIYDKPHNAKKITIDNPNNPEVEITDSLRFIATMNNDHTTELLSPRLIDRASFVKIKYSIPNDFEEDKSTQITNHTESSKRFYKQDFLNSIFSPKNPKLVRNESKIFKSIIDILNIEKPEFGRTIPISPRKIKSIFSYCEITREIYFNITGNQVLNLDFAIHQNILPLINGQGEKYEARLIEFNKILENNNLLRSSKELSFIINNGQDFKNFSFFD